MSDRTPRKRGVYVDVLDRAAITEKARQILSLIHDCGVDTLDGLELEDLYLLRLESGIDGLSEEMDNRWPTYAALGVEGVSYPADARGVTPVKFTLGFSEITVPMSWKVLTSLTTGEKLELADVIRTFGDRLEGNFHNHYRRAHSTARHTPEHVHTGFEAGAL